MIFTFHQFYKSPEHNIELVQNYWPNLVSFISQNPSSIIVDPNFDYSIIILGIIIIITFLTIVMALIVYIVYAKGIRELRGLYPNFYKYERMMCGSFTMQLVLFVVFLQIPNCISALFYVLALFNDDFSHLYVNYCEISLLIASLHAIVEFISQIIIIAPYRRFLKSILYILEKWYNYTGFGVFYTHTELLESDIKFGSFVVELGNR